MLLKKLKDATGFDTSNLVASRDFIALQLKVFNVLSGLKNLKTKVDDFDADKLETVPVDLKKLSHAVSL